MFKVGDKVRILEREGEENDYPASYVKSMTLYAGKIAKIVEVQENKLTGYAKKRKYYNGDPNTYILDITGSYVWDSSMFIKDDSMLDEYYINNSPGELWVPNTPVIYNNDKDTIDRNDPSDPGEPYHVKRKDHWIRQDEWIYPDFLTLFEDYKSVIFYSVIFGKMKITKQKSSEYPLLAELEDGDLFELTIDFKYFKNSKSHIL